MADSGEVNAAGEQYLGGSRGLRRSRPAGPGPTRRPPYSKMAPYATIPRGLENRLQTAARGGGGSGTMLYISNLHYEVSDGDINVLFSSVGDLKHFAIHYDKSDRSKGIGEVVFLHQCDAQMAIRRFNNMPLDGKPMKIEEVAMDYFETPAVPRMWPGVSLRNSRASLERYVPGGDARFSRVANYDSRTQRRYGQERRNERSQRKQVTAAELDADLERYHLEAYKKY